MSKDKTEYRIHYKDLLAAWQVMRSIPPDAFQVIVAKPPGKDKTADSRWRRMCAKHGIDVRPRTQPVNAQYHREYRLRKQIERRDEDLAVLREEVAQYRVREAAGPLPERLRRVGEHIGIQKDNPKQ